MGEEKEVTRRDWLKYTAGAVGGLVVGGAVGYLTKPAAPAEARTITVTQTPPTQTITVTQAPPTPTLPSKKYTFWVADHGLPGNPFWTVAYKGIDDAVEFLRSSGLADITIKHTYSSEDYKKQAEDLKTAVASKPDGILFTVPSDPLLYDATVREGVEKGIPFIALNCDDPRPPEERMPYLTYVGEAAYEVGPALARDLSRYVEEHKTFKPKKVLCGLPVAGHFIWETRLRLFGDYCKKYFDSTVITEILGVDPAKMSEVYRALLMANPDIDCMASFGWGLELAMPVLAELGKTPGKDVLIVALDPTPKVMDYIKEGTMVNCFDQQQYLQGFLPAILMYEYLEHQFAVFGTICTGPFIITEHNVDLVMASGKAGYR